MRSLENSVFLLSIFVSLVCKAKRQMLSTRGLGNSVWVLVSLTHIIMRREGYLRG